MPIQDTKKTMPSVEEVEAMHQKIQQNQMESEAFKKSLHDLLAGDKALASRPLVIGKTPNILAVCGQITGVNINTETDLTIKKKIIDKAMRPEVRGEDGRRTKKSGHFLTEKQVWQSLVGLQEPVMILQGSRPETLVAVTEFKDDKGQEIIVPLEFNKAGDVAEINVVTSLYGREEFAEYLQENLIDGKIVAINEEKAEEMLLSIGVDFPKANTFISFDNSISYSTENVKYPAEKNLEISEKSAERPTEKLVPVLNAIYEKHENRIDSLQSKRDRRMDKIARNEAKIESLTAKAEKLEAMNELLKGLSTGVLAAPIASIIKQNEQRIDGIRSQSIPNCEAKIEIHKAAIAVIDHKMEVSQAKADKMLHLSNAIKSFLIPDAAERRQQFTQSMDGLHDASKRILTFKLEKVNSQLAALDAKLGEAATSKESRRILDKINTLTQHKEALQERLDRITGVDKSFEQCTPEQTDNLMTHTEEAVNTVFADVNVEFAQAAEIIVIDAADYLRTAEMSMEQNYNSIDGVINNLPEEEHTEAAETPLLTEEELKKIKQALMSVEIFGEVFYFKVNESSIDDILAAANEEKPIVKLMEMGEQISDVEYAEIQQSIFFTYSVEINLNSGTANIYIVNDGKGGISEADRTDDNIHFDTLKISDYGKEQTTEQQKSDVLKIDPEYYISLPKAERMISIETKQTAQKIMQKLDEQNIPYSAVQRGSSAVAITVSKTHEQQFRQAEQTAKAENIKEFINPEFYKKLSQEERHTQRMTTTEALSTIQKLEKAGVQHSAVIDGDKAAVTVEKNGKGMPFFSRKQMHQQHKKVQQTSKKPEEQQQKKKNEQNL